MMLYLYGVRMLRGSAIFKRRVRLYVFLRVAARGTARLSDMFVDHGRWLSAAGVRPASRRPY